MTHLRDGRYKNNSPKGWRDGELNGQHENNSPKDGKSNGRHENNFSKGWTVQKKKTQGMGGTKITHQRDGLMES